MSHTFTAIANLGATGYQLPATGLSCWPLVAGSWQPLRRDLVDFGKVL